MPGNHNSGGQNAKTVEQHKSDGTYRKDRHANASAVDPPKGTPRPPDTLIGNALAEWDRMVKRLLDSKTLRLVDDAVIYQYACLYGETLEIKENIDRARKQAKKLYAVAMELHGSEFVEATKAVLGVEQMSKRFQQELRQARLAIRMYLIEMGMTPSSRGRVKITKDPEKPAGSNLRAFRGGLLKQTEEEEGDE